MTSDLSRRRFIQTAIASAAVLALAPVAAAEASSYVTAAEGERYMRQRLDGNRFVFMRNTGRILRQQPLKSCYLHEIVYGHGSPEHSATIAAELHALQDGPYWTLLLDHQATNLANRLGDMRRGLLFFGTYGYGYQCQDSENPEHRFRLEEAWQEGDGAVPLFKRPTHATPERLRALSLPAVST